MPERLDDYLQVILLEHADEVANDRIHPLLECHTALAFASAIALHQLDGSTHLQFTSTLLRRLVGWFVKMPF